MMRCFQLLLLLSNGSISLLTFLQSGSLYYNYKGYFSVILMALVDANYKFIWVNVGANGSASDSQVFNHSELRTMLEEDNLGLPDADTLPGDIETLRFFPDW